MTTEEIASLAGVSAKTVARVARALASQRNPVVALVHDDSDDGICQAVRTGMAQALVESELALLLLPLAGEAPEAELRVLLARHRPAGLVILPPFSERADMALLCEETGVSCVTLGGSPRETGLNCDNRSAMASLVSWFVRLGHERIALVSGPETSPIAQQRELGYLDAMADHGLDRGPSLIVSGDNSSASGHAAGRLLLEVSPRPTAIIACNDEMAAGVLQAAAQAGARVPADVSVAGFDDTPLAARLLPPLTSMHAPWERMGREAAAAIASAETGAVAKALLDTELTIRDSVRPLTD